MLGHTVGFQIFGSVYDGRCVRDAASDLVSCVACEPESMPGREGYLSAFWFTSEFADFHQRKGGRVAQYPGSCWAPWLWADIDREDDLPQALADARRFAAYMVERYHLDEDAVWPFFSGAKGFHVGIWTANWSLQPSTYFNQEARVLMLGFAEEAGITIDRSVFDKVRPFRRPNSKHPKGLHKIPLTFNELMELRLEAILALAAQPRPREVPRPRTTMQLAPPREQLQPYEQDSRSYPHSFDARQSHNGKAHISPDTRDFLVHGAPRTERHIRLYKAAINLADFDSLQQLIRALLDKPARDSGLPPGEIDRTIRDAVLRRRR